MPILYVSHALAEVARLATTLVADRRRPRPARRSRRRSAVRPGHLPLGLACATPGAVLHATVAAQDADGLTRLDCAGGAAVAAAHRGPLGTPLRVRISAQDVILSRTRPEGLSALNILHATVAELRLGDGPGALVQLARRRRPPARPPHPPLGRGAAPRPRHPRLRHPEIGRRRPGRRRHRRLTARPLHPIFTARRLPCAKPAEPPMHTLLTLPTAEILATALLRDRTTLDPAALEDLAASIATDGLRQPIEVWQLSTPSDGHRYGLISGLRRLTALRLLADRRGKGAFTTIPAFLCTPQDVPAAMAQMIAENEIRENLSPWERGATLVNATTCGLFDTLDQATAALHPTASRQKRNRLRSLAQVVEETDGLFTTPEALTQTQMERIAAALRGGLAPLITQILTEQRGQSLPTQWAALIPTLREALDPDPEPTPHTAGRPRRMLHLKQGLTIRREPCQNGWLLRMTGPEAKKGGLVDDVLDMVERMFQREG